MPNQKYHMCMNVRDFLEHSKKRDYKGVFTHDDGRPMTYDEARDALYEELLKGHRVIPFGTGCDHFDYGGKGCLGHLVEE